MNRPGIFQVGKVTDDGTTVVISGWGLGLCAAGCDCHRHGVTGSLAIFEEQGAGTLGLMSYRAGCNCCQPGTADELAAVVRDLADIEMNCDTQQLD